MSSGSLIMYPEYSRRTLSLFVPKGQHKSRWQHSNLMANYIYYNCFIISCCSLLLCFIYKLKYVIEMCRKTQYTRSLALSVVSGIPWGSWNLSPWMRGWEGCCTSAVTLPTGHFIRAWAKSTSLPSQLSIQGAALAHLFIPLSPRSKAAHNLESCLSNSNPLTEKMWKMGGGEPALTRACLKPNPGPSFLKCNTRSTACEPQKSLGETLLRAVESIIYHQAGMHVLEWQQQSQIPIHWMSSSSRIHQRILTSKESTWILELVVGAGIERIQNGAPANAEHGLFAICRLAATAHFTPLLTTDQQRRQQW